MDHEHDPDDLRPLREDLERAHEELAAARRLIAQQHAWLTAAQEAIGAPSFSTIAEDIVARLAHGA